MESVDLALQTESRQKRVGRRKEGRGQMAPKKAQVPEIFFKKMILKRFLHKKEGESQMPFTVLPNRAVDAHESEALPPDLEGKRLWAQPSFSITHRYDKTFSEELVTKECHSHACSS